MGILQARILEWVAFPPPGHPPAPGTELVPLASPALAGRSFTTEPPGKSYSFGTLTIYARPFGCPSTSVENFSAHRKGYLPQVFLEPIHLPANLPLMLSCYHFFDVVLTLQITAAIWSFVSSPASGSDFLNDQGSLLLFSESLARATMAHSVGLPPDIHPSFPANKTLLCGKLYEL